MRSDSGLDVWILANDEEEEMKERSTKVFRQTGTEHVRWIEGVEHAASL